MVFGEAGLALSHLNALVRVGAAAAIVGAVAALARDYTRAMIRPALYFLVVWIALGLAPTLVAGLRLASSHVSGVSRLGVIRWALRSASSGTPVWVRLAGRPRRLGVVFATAILVVYGVQLRAEVRLWGIRSEVSHRIVQDLERETMSAPRGSLVLVDPPPRSWNFALPFALRPPFTREDLPSRVLVISHSSIHCCAANYWEPYTRRTVRTWLENPARPPVIALRWDQDTGELFRLSDSDDPFLRSAVATLLDTPDVTTLDRLILNITRGTDAQYHQIDGCQRS